MVDPLVSSSITRREETNSGINTSHNSFGVCYYSHSFQALSSINPAGSASRNPSHAALNGTLWNHQADGETPVPDGVGEILLSNRDDHSGKLVPLTKSRQGPLQALGRVSAE